MKDFQTIVSQLTEQLYSPHDMALTAICEEPQNAAYSAGIFQTALKTVRFRVAKQTPKKIGQFVAFWEKDSHNKNQAFSYEEAPDLLVITTFKNVHHYGQFVFPKEVLLKRKILRTDSNPGKMAMRVYPSWDHPTSKQAITTQNWQLPYFVDMRDITPEKLHFLYK